MRYRPLMIVSALEKLSYAGAIGVVYFQDRISSMMAATAIPDAVFMILFVTAYWVTPGSFATSPSTPSELTA